MQTILTVVHVFLAIGVIGLVLMQHGKGADAGAAFGSGASGTVFGAQGASNFLSRATAVLATLFFVTSVALGYFSMQREESVDLMQGAVGQPEKVAPETPAVASDIPQVPMEPQAVSDVPVVAAEQPVVVDKPEATEFVAPDQPAVKPVQATDIPSVPEAAEEKKGE